RWLVRPGAPPSRLAFPATGTALADSVTGPSGAFSLLLAPSLFAGAVIDTGATRLHFADGRLVVDSLRLQQPGLLTGGSGSLGWRRPDHGTLILDFAADSLSVLDSLVTWFAGPSFVAASNDAKLSGSAAARRALDGALDSMSLGANASVADLQWRRWRLPKGEG